MAVELLDKFVSLLDVYWNNMDDITSFCSTMFHVKHSHVI